MKTPDVAAMSRAFQALSVPSRLKTFLILVDKGEETVSGLVEATGLPQPSVSHHLSWFRSAGLVSSRRHGRYRYYYPVKPDDFTFPIDMKFFNVKRGGFICFGGNFNDS